MMSTPSRVKKDKEIIAEYESQVKGKDGSGRRAPFVCSLVMVLGELHFSLGVCDGGRGLGTVRAPGTATWGSLQASSSPSPVKPAGSWEVGGFPWLPARSSKRETTGFNFTTFGCATYMVATYRGGRQQQCFLPGYPHPHPFIMIPLSQHNF